MRKTTAARFIEGTPAVMVDIETLDTLPSAVCYELGALLMVFDRSTATITIQQGLHVLLDPKEQEICGGTISASTMEWTRKTKGRSEALAEAAQTGGSVSALHKLLSQGINPDTPVIVNGSNFDPPILATMFSRAELDTPWSFWNVLDLRTLNFAAYFADGKDPVKGASGASHDALDDCRRQVRILAAALGQVSGTTITVEDRSNRGP